MQHRGVVKVWSAAKTGHPSLPNNHKSSLARLSYLVRKLQKVPSHLDDFDKLIQGQPKGGFSGEGER